MIGLKEISKTHLFLQQASRWLTLHILLSQTFPLNSQYKVFANKLLISNGIYFMYHRYDYKIYLLNMNFSRLCASV